VEGEKVQVPGTRSNIFRCFFWRPGRHRVASRWGEVMEGQGYRKGQDSEWKGEEEVQVPGTRFCVFGRFL
jgi:hypothetical protein